ncbi:MAG: DEAD/DEAH box helicase [Eudoraea sp.]|nr:DEAD/DEAH box helicase [Eudoraea sp.]
MTTFKALGLNEPFVNATLDLGFESPTEIQEKTIPMLLTGERDLIALAQTGTGKTAAFGLPLLQSIAIESRVTQAVILSPTRELCMQITKEVQQYGKYLKGLNAVAVYGGASINEQAKQLKRGAQVIIATPGRLKDLMSRGFIDLSKITHCILDEADEMLNMGFYPEIKEILSKSPDDKSTWLFSATMPKEVSRIAMKFMHDPFEIAVGEKNTSTDSVRHEYYTIGGRDRYPALKRLVDANPGIFSVIFCRTKRDTQKIAEKLIEDGYNAGAIHGDLSQNQRDIVMNAFRKKQLQLMVATDVAARGIDVEDITHVINYQLPDEIETYTHRSGRTGRAGRSGISMVIATRSELRKIHAIEKKIKQEFVNKKIPTGLEICEIQLYHLANRVKETAIDNDVAGYLPAIYDVFEGITRDELINKMMSVEFRRFHDYYSKSKDLNSPDGRGESRQSKSRSKSYSSDTTRYFITLGERDGFDWKSLKDFIIDELRVGGDEIFRIDVKESFSFFNTAPDLQEYVLSTLSASNFKGRAISIEISRNPEIAPGGRRRKKNRSKGSNYKKRDGFHGGRKKKGKTSGKRRKKR